MNGNFMPILGGLVVIGVLLGYGFYAVNAAGLESRSAEAVVLGKDYKPLSRTYSTELIGGSTAVVPKVNAESFLLRLNVDGKESLFAVRKEFYDSVRNGERVRVTYQKRRITGSLQITGVSR